MYNSSSFPLYKIETKKNSYEWSNWARNRILVLFLKLNAYYQGSL